MRLAERIKPFKWPTTAATIQMRFLHTQNQNRQPKSSLPNSNASNQTLRIHHHHAHTQILIPNPTTLLNHNRNTKANLPRNIPNQPTKNKPNSRPASPQTPPTTTPSSTRMPHHRHNSRVTASVLLHKLTMDVYHLRLDRLGHQPRAAAAPTRHFSHFSRQWTQRGWAS